MNKNYNSDRDKLFENIKKSYCNISEVDNIIFGVNKQYTKKQNIKKGILISAFIVGSLVAGYAIYNYYNTSQESKSSTNNPSFLELRVGE